MNEPTKNLAPLKPIPVQVRRHREEKRYKPGDFTEAMLSAPTPNDGMLAVVAILMSDAEGGAR